ncbi:DeoR family transcriptional regulator [Lentzea sp. HUAS12]|uniref:DeoR family transcriptional regulator n=1 Tax=Lentzea sp. HUAS12 TaxID=2951806 RepID=UPI00209D3877|nr:DeoR family transcriptional regulator [Lentzea sp. HUAS12]USX54412.1 DeoR family transcriptional regulator [Lentzea sp. HUAS12]
MATGQAPGDLTVTERRQRIVALVRRLGFVQVRPLAHDLGVSEVTIRQDLRSLEECGALHRVRGGAAATSGSATPGTAVPSRGARADWAEPAVGTTVAAFVRSGDVLVLDHAPGIRAVAEALVSRRDLSGVVVHTESLRALAPFAGHSDRFTVVVPTGTLDATHRVVPDRETEVDADLAVLGCAGVSVEGILARTEPEAFARRRAAFAARRGIVVVPPDAFDAPGDHLVCSLDHVDACITGQALDEAVAGPLRAAGLRIFAVT